MGLANILRGKQPFKANIFAKYFTLFVAIFFVVLTILGSSLIILVSAYTQNERTRLIRENAQSVAESVGSALTVEDMNYSYSITKEMLCESLYMISNSIDADMFICDVEGNVILCKEKAFSSPDFGEFGNCRRHDGLVINSFILKSVYEGGYLGKQVLNNQICYIVAYPIISGGQIIGCIFATTETGNVPIVQAVIRMFIFSALACLFIAFICIYVLTKRMVTPLRQMSMAAKQFAVGDFSYRVKVSGNDELSNLGDAFNDMADSLDKLESSRSSFVANVSHELKTPMTSIAGFIDGILDGTIPEDKEKYYLGIVRGEITRLSRLVVTMLNMSKIESGEFVMKPNNYDISDQIIHILLTFEQKISNKNIEILGLDNLRPTYIEADPDMIYQVIYNIFDNAVKFTNDNGYIQITLDDLTDKIRVTIKNSGNGINHEELSRVFERFYKVDKSRSLDAKGAGLGLYIVKMMVEMHGGKVHAQSNDEHSAEFIFTLPKHYSPINKKELKK